MYSHIDTAVGSDGTRRLRDIVCGGIGTQNWNKVKHRQVGALWEAYSYSSTMLYMGHGYDV